MKPSLPDFFRGPNVFAFSVFALSMTLALLVALALPSSAQTSLARISVDNLTNTDSDHKTEVEPDTFAWGSTIVSAFHVARRPGSVGWGSGDVASRPPSTAARPGTTAISPASPSTSKAEPTAPQQIPPSLTMQSMDNG